MLVPLLTERLQELLAPRYQIQRELAGGSMALLYLAEDTRHGRPVAIKVLVHEHAGQFAADRFLREIAIAARLQHPHIVPVLDSGAAAGILYLVMPFIEGESLRARLAREGRLSVPDTVRILADVADALAYAHRKGIVHRDIKPDNILLAGRHALVTDFGVAKAITDATVVQSDITTGVALGTPTYMAPEQATADPEVDHRADLYALGVVGYELLTGAPPFTGESAQQILTAHVLDDPAPLGQARPETPLPLVSLLHRALAKRRQDRWATAEELLLHLEPLATPSEGVPPPVLPPRGAGGWLWWLGGVAAVVLALLLGARYMVGAAPRPMHLTERQLTFSGAVTAGAISPDGQLLAYVERRMGRSQLLVQDLQGGSPIVVAERRDIRAVTWSGDGSELRFQSREDSTPMLYRVPRLGGTLRGVARGSRPALSKDGSRLAVMPTAQPNLHLIGMERWDTTLIPLGEYMWYETPSWSRDGSRLAVAGATAESRRFGLYVVIPALGRASVVLRDSQQVGSPTLAPDNRAVYYLRLSGSLVDLMRLPLTHDGAADGAPELVLQGLAGSLAEESALSFTDDGSRLVYFRAAMWDEVTLRSLDSLGRGRPLLARPGIAWGVRHGPKGQGVAYLREESNGTSLHVVPDSTMPERELLRVRDAGRLSWSPDGRFIALPAIRDDSAMALRIVPLEGGPVRSYLAGKTGWISEWLSDSTLVVQRRGNRMLDLLNLRTGAVRPLPGLDTLGWVFAPARSPDGTTLAVYWNRTDQSGIQLIDLATGSRRRLLTRNLMPIRWSADGRSLYASPLLGAVDSTLLYAVDVRSGSIRTLTNFAPNDYIEDITPDGREVVVREISRRGDAWMMSLQP